MDKSDELQLLEPMMRAKQVLQLGILASEIAVETILDFMERIRDGSQDSGLVSLSTIIPSRHGHAETSEVMAAANALRSWHTTGRVMDGKRRREALAALEALDLSLAFHKELVRRLEQVPACKAEASQLEAEILISESATEHLIREHLPYVRRFASRNVEEGEEPEGVFQVAFMGLQRSTRRFDPERGYRFPIYATYWMRLAITRWRADEGAATRGTPSVAAITAATFFAVHTLPSSGGVFTRSRSIASTSGVRIFGFAPLPRRRSPRLDGPKRL
ncbi:sigma factor [Pararhodobacter sp. SW119]|uniref:sigma factor n=1 Tax=Pararhodobacter sp. SW119 TaxID=2780075 RepID=UPI001FD7D1F0|nr:sigma factor [Pararhodobacter sp. SW119]